MEEQSHKVLNMRAYILSKSLFVTFVKIIGSKKRSKFSLEAVRFK
jgi:hypothetical protein